jgi:hypothetical protein
MTDNNIQSLSTTPTYNKQLTTDTSGIRPRLLEISNISRDTLRLLFPTRAGTRICITKQAIMIARLMPVGPDVNRYFTSTAGLDPLTGIFFKRYFSAI